MLLAEGSVEEAIAHLERAATIAPSHEAVNLRLGLAYLEAGRGEDAYRTLLLVRRLHPGNWAATVGLAVVHAARQEPEPARRLLDQALAGGGADARRMAASYPALADYLD